MSASSDGWAAVPRAEGPVFLRLLEDAGAGSDAGPRVLADRFQLVERITCSAPVRGWLALARGAGGLSRWVRLKHLDPSAPDFDVWRAALLDEATALTAVDHPHVVSLLDVVEDEAGLVLVREHVDGPSLADVLSVCQGAGAGVPFELSVHLASELLWVVHAVHNASDPAGRPLQLVHRGVHPSQVQITRSGHVKLDGFELVRMASGRSAATEPGLVKGFAAYLPPECIAGEPAAATADVYAVGVMLFELLCGEPCFDGHNGAEILWKVVRKGPPLARLERHRVPPELREIVSRATQPSPEDRYQSAREMARALDAYAEMIRRPGRPWQVERFFEAQGLYPEPVGARLADVETALVDAHFGAAPAVEAQPVPASEAVRGAARVSSGLANAADEVTEVTARSAPPQGPGPSVQTVLPAQAYVDVSDLGLSPREEPELLADEDIVLISLDD